ncbi:MAG: carboxypeptidase regulatory-like domain-containing protein [Chloroflexota bacterium]
MAFEESPSLDLYKDGLPSRLPDPSHKRRRMWALIIGLAVLSLVLAFLNMVQDGTLAILTGTGDVTGTVYDDQGNPVAAEVFVFGTALSAQSDQTGRFELKGVPAGQQVVVVAYRNIGREYTVNVIAGQAVDMGEARFQPEDFMNGWSQSGDGEQ